jgi:hypothetical protein
MLDSARVPHPWAPHDRPMESPSASGTDCCGGIGTRVPDAAPGASSAVGIKQVPEGTICTKMHHAAWAVRRAAEREAQRERGAIGPRWNHLLALHCRPSRAPGTAVALYSAAHRASGRGNRSTSHQRRLRGDAGRERNSHGFLERFRLLLLIALRCSQSPATSDRLLRAGICDTSDQSQSWSEVHEHDEIGRVLKRVRH